MMKVGLLGCGLAAGQGFRMGKQTLIPHPKALELNPTTKLIAAYDPSRKKLDDFVSQWNCTATQSPETLITSGIDCLLICSPTPNHAEQILLGVQAGVPVIVCEKPLTLSAQEAEGLTEACDRTGTALYVYYPRRWIKDIQTLKDDVASMKWGRPTAFHAWYGKGVRNIGSHIIDLLGMVLGPVSTVSTVPGFKYDTPTSEATPTIALTFLSGTSGIIQAYDYDNFALVEFDFMFEKARVRLTDLGHRFRIDTIIDSPRYVGFKEPRNTADRETDYNQASVNFWLTVTENFSTGRPHIETAELETTRVLDAVEASLATENIVHVNSRN